MGFDVNCFLFPGPSDIMMFDKNSSTITIRWRPGKCAHSNGDVTGYSVRYGIQGNGSIQTVIVSGNDSTHTSISGLRSSTTCSIEVAAVNSVGIGMYSNPLNVTTSVAGNNPQNACVAKLTVIVLCVGVCVHIESTRHGEIFHNSDFR